MDIACMERQVKRNCEISNGRENTPRTPRELLEYQYATENRLHPCESIESRLFSRWLKAEAKSWKKAKNRKYSEIRIKNKAYGIYDNDGINEKIRPLGIFYNARDSYEGNPSFLLAKIKKAGRIGGYRLIFLGQELAKDIKRSFHSPTELYGKDIFYREYAEAYLFCRKTGYLKTKRGEAMRILADALRGRGDRKKTLDGEKQSHIHHELGHALVRDKKIIPEKIFDMASLASGTRAEWFIEALHEALADTIKNGRIFYISGKGSRELLGMYLHDLMEGFGKHPILTLKVRILAGSPKKCSDLYWDSKKNDNWDMVHAFRREAFARASGMAEELKKLAREDKTDAETRADLVRLFDKFSVTFS